MKLLLDTHLLLWAGLGDGASQSANGLSRAALQLIENPENELYFSPASVWEVAIKNALARADFKVDPHLFRQGMLDNGYVELPITSKHTAAVAGLPNIHRDPFDRLLIVQAIEEGALLLTNDSVVAAYPNVPVRLV